MLIIWKHCAVDGFIELVLRQKLLDEIASVIILRKLWIHAW